jgi:Right handed beta helix region
MSKSSLTLRILTFAVFTIALGALAQAQATRTWIAGTGNDADPCSRTAPCKTFSGAQSKTATNGEINCIDASAAGAITITKSLTIDGYGTQCSIIASGITGVTVNLTTSPDTEKMVRLRNFSINGTGSGAKTGIRGINVSTANLSAVTLVVDNMIIDNFVNEGILFSPPGGNLIVRDSRVTNCGTKGIMVDSKDTNIVHASIENTTLADNQEGLRAETAARVSASNCNISNNTLNGAVVQTSGGSPAEMNLFQCLISNNRQWGVLSNAASGAATIRLDGNHIVNNMGIAGAAGVNILAGGSVLSRGNNTISGNTADVQGGALGSIPNS